MAVLDVKNVNILPIDKAFANGLQALGVRVGKMIERLVGKNHTPAKCVRRLVALEHWDLMTRSLLLNKQAEVEPRRPAAHADNPHRDLPPTDPPTVYNRP